MVVEDKGKICGVRFLEGEPVENNLVKDEPHKDNGIRHDFVPSYKQICPYSLSTKSIVKAKEDSNISPQGPLHEDHEREVSDFVCCI